MYDPATLENARQTYPELGYALTLAEAARDAHVVLVLTEWAEFAELRPGGLAAVLARRNIVDKRNVLDSGLGVPPTGTTGLLEWRSPRRCHRIHAR